MEEIIPELRALPLAFNEPAADEDIARLHRTLSCTLPAEIAALYRDHDGMPQQRLRALRLLPLDEAQEFYQATAEYGWAERGVRFFWTDDNSNYAGVYVEGPLLGKVVFLDHEEPDLTPVYRSVASFLRCLLLAIEGGLDWYEMARDYPECHASNSEVSEEDWRLAQSLREHLERAGNEDDRRYWAMGIMALTPPKYTDTLIPFLSFDDMWVSERCCRVLGDRKFEPAIGRLVDLGRRQGVNSGIAALAALGAIGTPECLQQLLALIPELPPGVSIYLAKALEGCGCAVAHTRGQWRYRLPNADDWHELP